MEFSNDKGLGHQIMTWIQHDKYNTTARTLLKNANNTTNYTKATMMLKSSGFEWKNHVTSTRFVPFKT